MSGYRRFVAYVYEYRRGKKEENCGYIRVEARDEICNVEVHLKCPGLPGQVQGEIYGFIRNQGFMDGYLLHQCQTTQDALECEFRTETQRLGGMAAALSDLGGMVIRTEGGAFFGTEWDDHPIQPDVFRIHAENENMSVSAENGIPDNIATAEGSPSVSQATQNNTEKIVSIKNREKSREQTCNADHAPSESAETETKAELAASEILTKEKNSTDTQSEAVQDEAMQDGPVQTEAAQSSPVQVDAAQTCKPSEYAETDLSPVLNRDQILRAAHHADPFEPFPDGSISECRKIRAEDFCHLHPRDRGLRNNRFVAFSLRQFGFLLIGRLTNGQYILGLPGGYDQQERFLANSFGFPYFKQSPEIELPRARGGFWYRLINTPDFNQ